MRTTSRAHPVIACLAFFALLLPAGAAQAKSVTVTDAMDRAVTIELPVRRAVVLSDDAMEVVRLMGRMDRVVGTSTYIKSREPFYPEVAGMADVGRAFTPNLEAIAALRPDLVVTWTKWPGQEMEERLKPFGIQVLRLELYLVPLIEREVRVLGEVFEARDKAEAYLDWNRERTAELTACIGDGPRPRVLLESFSPMQIYGLGSGVDTLCELAGGDNVGRALSISSALVDTEWVVRAAPDAVFKSVTLRLETPDREQRRLDAIRDEIAARPGWSMVPAVREKRVFAMSTDVGGGPRYVVGLAYMLGRLHPGRCSGINPEALHREYLERFHGRRLDGAFLSSPMP